MRLSSAAIGTYHPQYRPLSAIRYLDANLLPIRYTLFITLPIHYSPLRKYQLAFTCVNWELYKLLIATSKDMFPLRNPFKIRDLAGRRQFRH